MAILFLHVNNNLGKYLVTKGVDTISSTSNDTIKNWTKQKNSIHFYMTNNKLIDQPSQYGYVINVGDTGNNVHQLWLEQPSGDISHRGGNSDGWAGTWKTLLDSSNYKEFCTLDNIGALKISSVYQKFVVTANKERLIQCSDTVFTSNTGISKSRVIAVVSPMIVAASGDLDSVKIYLSGDSDTSFRIISTISQDVYIRCFYLYI